jgi:hypothetical protein
MAEISIYRRFDLVPPRKDGGSEFLQIAAAYTEGGGTFAQKSGALCRKDMIEMIDRIAGRDGVHDRPQTDEIDVRALRLSSESRIQLSASSKALASFQIACVEAFGEPAVDRSEKFAGLHPGQRR